MVAFIPSPTKNYCVQYQSPAAHGSQDPSVLYIYATSEIHVKQILADYKILSIDLQESV
tara:strand:- start:195 stop:371 length:177 start_codon:yes stop_codon:yes gene_type:complete